MLTGQQNHVELPTMKHDEVELNIGGENRTYRLTTLLRWERRLRNDKHKCILQQGWVDIESGDIIWRDIPQFDEL
jgi:hypothetical protein